MAAWQEDVDRREVVGQLRGDRRSRSPPPLQPPPPPERKPVLERLGEKPGTLGTGTGSRHLKAY
jgi:hypothetical protein